MRTFDFKKAHMPMIQKKRIALIARDNHKENMVVWVRWNYHLLMEHQLICIGTTACNRSTADFMIFSQLMKEEYQPILKDYSAYLNRSV